MCLRRSAGSVDETIVSDVDEAEMGEGVDESKSVRGLSEDG